MPAQPTTVGGANMHEGLHHFGCNAALAFLLLTLVVALLVRR
jgi:hypothetical protein